MPEARSRRSLLGAWEGKGIVLPTEEEWRAMDKEIADEMINGSVFPPDPHVRLLLDSNVLLWQLTDPKQLTKRVLELLQDTQHDLFVSQASIWELAIKVAKGRLELPGSSVRSLLDEIDGSNIAVLPITATHILRTRPCRIFIVIRSTECSWQPSAKMRPGAGVVRVGRQVECVVAKTCWL